MPDSRVKADNVEPLGDALMLLSGVLDQASSLLRQNLNAHPQKLHGKRWAEIFE